MSSPNPASPIPTRSSDHRTSTDQGAAQVTLKTTMVSASVRTGGLPSSQRTPSAMSWRTWLSTSSRTAPGGVPIREISTTPTATKTVVSMKGNAVALAKSSAPTAGPTSWLAVTAPAMMRALAMPRSRLSTSIGTRVAPVASANTSAAPSARSAASTTAMLT